MTTTVNLNPSLDNSADVSAVALPWPGFKYWGEYHFAKRVARSYNLVDRNRDSVYSAEEYENFVRLDIDNAIKVVAPSANFTVFAVFRIDPAILAEKIAASYTLPLLAFDNLAGATTNNGIQAEIRPKGITSTTADALFLYEDGSKAAGTTTRLIVPAAQSDGFAGWNLLVWAKQGRTTTARLLGLNGRDVNATLAKTFDPRSQSDLLSVGGKFASDPAVDVAMFAHSSQTYDAVVLRQIISSIGKRMTKAGISYGQVA